MNTTWFRRLIVLCGALLCASPAAAVPVITGTSVSKTSANTGATLRVFCTDCGYATDRVHFPGFVDNYVNPTAWSLNSYVDVRVPDTWSGNIQLQKQGVGALSADHPHEISFSATGLEWPGGLLTWRLNSAGAPGSSFSATQMALQSAFSTWTCASGLNPVYSGSTATNVISNDGNNVLFWRSTGWSGPAIYSASRWFTVSTGEIVGSDVVFNSQHFTWSTTGAAGSMDVTGSAANALGQVIGLNLLHGVADTEKSMYGSMSLGETSTRTLHTDDALGAEFLYPHTRSNLRADGVPAGWYAGVTPRSTADATISSAPLPAVLNSALTTYVNAAMWNDGGDCVSPAGANEILLDDVSAIAMPWTGLWNPGVLSGDWRNFPLSVRGGRHTLTHELDVNEEALESNESDNSRDFQYVWSPTAIANQTVLAATAPPLPGNGLYDNCVGVQGTGNWWGCLAALPLSMSDDYDMLLFDDYAGSLAGFQTPLESSFSGIGQSDFVLWNGNVVGQNAVRQGGVTRFSAGAAAGVNVHFSQEVGTTLVPSVGYDTQASTPTITIGGAQVVKVHEVYLGSTTTTYRFTLDNLTGTGDLNFGLYASDVATFRKSEFLRASITTGAGTDEEFEYQPAVSGFYAVVVWKRNALDVGLTNTYQLRVGPALSNLTAEYDLAGATARNVPRTDPWTSGPLTVSPTLPGEVPTTRLHSVHRFEGPTAIPGYEVQLLVDDQPVGFLTQPALPSPITYVTVQLGVTVPGGRHTVGQELDVDSEVAESDESDNDSENQYVWDPAAAFDRTPLALAAPPVRGVGVYPNSSGRRYTRTVALEWVSALAPVSPGDDYDLYLYDDYASSTSGFSNLRKTSEYGSNLTEFVVGAFNSTPLVVYPAAIRYGVSGGAAGFSFDHNNAQARIGLGSGLAFRDQSLPSGRLADVFAVELAAGQRERFVLWRQSGSDDITFSVFPPTVGGVFSRSEASAFSTPWGSERDTLVFTAPTAGWYPIVVFRTDGTEANTALTYTFGWDDQQILDAPGAGGPATLALAGPFPNPARAGSRLSFTLPQAGRATLELFDVDGRKRATLAEGEFAAGQHERVLPGSKLAPGLYWARLQAEGRTLSRRVTVIGE